MKIYNYDRITKEFTAESIAAEDPLEQGNWLVPANSTEIAPILEEGKVPVFNGTSWDLLENNRGLIYNILTQESSLFTELGPVPEGFTKVIPPGHPCYTYITSSQEWEIDLPKARKYVWEEIKTFRDSRNQNGGFKVGDLWFHSDTFSRSQYLGLVLLAERDQIPENIQWKTMSGEFVLLTPELALSVFLTATQSDVTTFAAAEAHKAQLDLSEDPLNYDYSSGWPEIYVGE